MPALLRALQENRTARAIVLDNKGDFTSQLPPSTTILLAPWDRRAVPWDIAQDVRTALDAELFAESLIPMTTGENAFFCKAARILLTGFIVCLQKKFGTLWGWEELAACLDSSTEELRIDFSAYFPFGLKLLLEDSKTSESVLITTTADMSFIRHLSAAWPWSIGGFSFRNWMRTGDAADRVVIIQANKGFPTLSDSICCAMLGMASSILLSPQIADSQKRRIFFVLDEIAQIPKVKQLKNLVALGRAKGAAVWLGVQDLDLLVDTYGRQEVNSLISMLRCKVLLQTGAGPSAEFVSGLLGRREIRERVQGPERGATRMEPLVLPSEVSGLPLASLKRGAEGWLVIDGWPGTMRLRWPIRANGQRQAGVELAHWIDGKAYEGAVKGLKRLKRRTTGA
jgi:hypothetical protein